VIKIAKIQFNKSNEQFYIYLSKDLLTLLGWAKGDTVYQSKEGSRIVLEKVSNGNNNHKESDKDVK
jgi:hypothetical protein